MKVKLLFSIVFSFLLGVGIFLLSNNKYAKKIPIQNEKKFITASVVGAVRFHDNFSVLAGSTVRDILMKAELLYGADLSKINFQEKLYKDKTLLVPFKEGLEQKYRISRGINKDVLIKRGISSRVAKLVVEYLEKNKGKDISWNDLDSIHGVGSVTLNQLKKILELN